MRIDSFRGFFFFVFVHKQLKKSELDITLIVLNNYEYSTLNLVGEASTWGKGAYKAFNGRIFVFESSCTYTFCRHCVESGGDFNIEIKRNNESDIEKITVIIDSNDISITGDIILVNGER